jgi:hypothetical protein
MSAAWRQRFHICNSSPCTKHVIMHTFRPRKAPGVVGIQDDEPVIAPHRTRFYTREEDFLNEYESTAYTAARFLTNDWHPNPSCDDTSRKQTERLCEKGELMHLVFDCAFIDQDEHGFLSVQIHLKSSTRRVIVGVKRVNNLLVAEKIGDHTTP